MKDLSRFILAVLILLINSSAEVFSSQMPGEHKLPVNTSDNDPQRIIAGPVRSQNDKTEITEEQKQKFLDENGVPLFESARRSLTDTLEGDSFQEHGFTGAYPGDYLGFSVASAGDVNADGFDDIIVGAPFFDGLGTDKGFAYIYSGGPNMDYSPDLAMFGQFVNERFGYSVAPAGDVNNDGYDDVIVGAIGAGAVLGKAYIHFGGATMNNIPDVILSAELPGDFFGISVSTAGDVNDDGFSDVIVGAYGYNGYTGKAYLYHGGSSMDNVADLTFYSGVSGGIFGVSVSCAGDVNADGYSDVCIGESGYNSNSGRAYVYLGGPGMNNVADMTASGSMGENFGISVSGAGDMNGDGYSDIVVGAFLKNSSAGAAYIFFGGVVMNNTADATLNGIAAGDLFGCSVSSAGDVNGDGYSDVLIGAKQNDLGGSNSGSAYIFYGGITVNNVPDAVFTGAAANDNFGYSVASAGDVNNDGYIDVIIGAPYNDQTGSDAGKAYVFTNTQNFVSTPINSFLGEYQGGQFGVTVSDAGDVNGDGFPDVIVGAPVSGKAYIYFGGRLMDNFADVTINQITPLDLLGACVSSAGDVNNDGFDDVIIGAYNGGASTGKAYIYLGSMNMDNSPDIVFTGENPNDQFGFSVSSAGDVNGDSYSDVIIGAPRTNTSTGKAYIYYGGINMNNSADVTMTGETQYSYFGERVSTAGDVNNDNFYDVIVGARGYNVNSGRTYIFLGGPLMNNIADVTINGGLNNRMGRSVSNAGDVNADGFDDVIVGGYIPGNNPLENKGTAYVFYGGVSMNNVADISMTGIDFYYNFGESVSSAGDYNNDGYDDFAVSAHTAQRVYVYFGGPAVNDKPDVIISGERANSSEYIGMSISFAGDVNGDGYDDLIAGGFYDYLSFGAAYIFTYSQTGTDIDDGAFTAELGGDWFGYSVATAGDVNADGFSDVIIGARLGSGGGLQYGSAYIYYGGNPMDYNPDVTMRGEASVSQFGFSVSTAGDVNADGFSDVIVGSNKIGPGRAYIFYGGAVMNNVPDVILTGLVQGDEFGFSVSSAGNYNGNGFGDIYDDVIVGAIYAQGNVNRSGAAYIFYGGSNMDNIPDVTFGGEGYEDWFGSSVSKAEDINYDSYGDVIIGASKNDANGTNAGRAYIYFGGPFLVPSVTLSGTSEYDYFGTSVAGVGDVNGDYYRDVLVGAYGNDDNAPNSGKAYLFYGNAAMDNVRDVWFAGENAGDYLGVYVSSAGDVNADGLGDLIVGAHGSDAAGTDFGKAYVYFGKPTTVNTPDFTMTGKTSGGAFGWSVANAGDVNGDGRSDQLVGAFYDNTSGYEAGRAYLFLSSDPSQHCIITLKMILQAFYNPGNETMNISDTIRINLRSSTYPYNIIDYAKAVVNKTSFTTKFYFRTAPSGNYYLDVRHRNSIETWSASPVTLTRNVNTNYDLTNAANKSYGGNIVQVDNSPVRFAIYSGDVNQDGIVDATDALLIDNDINNYVTGYVDTDVNGDYSVDATDALIVDNNANNFVGKVTP
jgi:hypothetical protein